MKTEKVRFREERTEEVRKILLANGLIVAVGEPTPTKEEGVVEMRVWYSHSQEEKEEAE